MFFFEISPNVMDPIIKTDFKYKKVSYKGMTKNAAFHTMLFALANLVIVKKALLNQGNN